jgi:CRISPR-associated endoribonuclease Cas6
MELEKLKFLKLHFSFVATDKIYFPENLKGNIFRGAFGIIFKRLNCKSTPICEKKCQDATCLYGKIFEPQNFYKPLRYKDIPRPFVFSLNNDERKFIYEGEYFNIGINLFGWAIDYYLHFIRAIEEIGNEGIGPLRGKYLIRNLFYEDYYGNYFSLKNNNAYIQPETLKLPETEFNYDTSNTKEFKILFLTPTLIKYDNRIIRNPDFYQIFCRIRDRISAIAYFHNGIKLSENFKELEEEAKKVNIKESKIRWVDVKRRSSKTGLTQELSGIKGSITFDLKDKELFKSFYPWIKLAEITGVGKNTVWGMGKIKLDIIKTKNEIIKRIHN